MKGIIFNLAEEVVTTAYGEGTWESLLDAAGLDGAYTSLGNYPDEHLFALVSAAATALDRPADDVVRDIGEGAMPLLAERYPDFFSGHNDVRSFVLTLNEVIHAEVRKLYPDADVPVFGFDTSNADVLVLSYDSKRKLCFLAEGFISGAAAHYGQRVEIDQPACMKRGDDRCLIRCAFSSPDRADGGR